MLELAILGLLKDEELHGYELKRRMTETLGAFSTLSFGSLYPALGRLETAGAVKAVTAPPAPAEQPLPSFPATGSLGAELAAFRARRARVEAPKGHGARSGKARKVYGITQAGEALFEELLTADPASLDDDREFTLRLAFARFLPPESRVRLLERRRATLIERLARSRQQRKAALDAYADALLAHGAETTQHDITWLDGLIEAEKSATTATPGTATPGTATPTNN